jgi:acetyl-CoA carboxylase biotin carboxylase subunit
MIAKVICWDQDRSRAIARMEGALRAARISGIRTTIPYHLRILGNAYFRRGDVDIHFIERRLGSNEGG